MLLHRFFIQDSDLLPVEAFIPNTGIEIYEVIRVMNGVPLFLGDHLKRFSHSAWLLHLEIPLGEDIVKSLIERLIRKNGVTEGNIRFSWCFRPSGRFHAYFIPHHYPAGRDYCDGVACGLLRAERPDPGIKAVQAGLRELADQIIREQGFYEVFLVNHSGMITEGSRSNVFFIRENRLITAPGEEILPGITRRKVLELASLRGIEVEYRAPLESGLDQMEAAFISGTSPKVLPVRSIEQLSYHPAHPVTDLLMQDYNRLLEQEIANYPAGA